MNERFDADWLALREPFDCAARNLALAHRFAALLPRRPCVMDLGAGAGSMFRFLAPIIGRGQDWILVDADDTLLDDAFGRTAAWARRRGYGATAEDEILSLSTPQGLWRMRVEVRELDHQDQWQMQVHSPSLEGIGGRGQSGTGHVPARGGGVSATAPAFTSDLPCIDAVVCSALLDLVSAAWFTKLRSSLTVPLLACLTVDGRDTWRPRHPHDAVVRAAFHRDMRRNKGFGPALGTAALRTLTATASAPSDWHIPRTALSMQRALIDGTADASRRADPSHAAAITAWQEARLKQALTGRLAITIGHRDILLVPSGG